MKSYLFVFGRTPKLSLLELQTFYPKTINLDYSVGLVQTDVLLPIDRLGGTIKIAEVTEKVDVVTPEILAEYLMGSRNYGVTSFGTQISRDFLEEIKKLIGGRFVENLSSVVIRKQHITELIIAKHEKKFIIAKTIAVQDFEAWNKRDYGRPYADPKSGMLPPKVARMAVNLVTGTTLLDPFCGMGTIVAEAALSGWKVLGSDQNPDIVAKAQKNLDWLASNSPQPPLNVRGGEGGVMNWQLFVSDATHVSEKLEKNSVDAIVTEPFMGNPDAKPKDFKYIIRGLEKLYIGCLKDWQHVLKSHGKVVIALPEYAAGGRTYFVKKVIDNCENLGYTVLHGPIEYSRPQAIVRRQFYILKVKKIIQ